MRLRLASKRVAYTVLSWAARMRRRAPRAPDRSQLREVMIVQLGLMGDVLLMTPLLRRVRESLPGARISLVVPPSQREVVERSPYVDAVVTYDAFWADPSDNHRHALHWRHLADTIRFIARNRATAHDLIINCWVMDQPLTVLLLSLLRTRFLLGFDFRYSRRFYDATVRIDPQLHIADNAVALFERVVPADVADAPSHLSYVIPDSVHTPRFDALVRGMTRPYLLIAPFSSESTKEWDLAHWATVLRHLASQFPGVGQVLSGLPEARLRGDTLARDLGAGIVNVVGELSLPQFAYLVKHAAAVITTESGAMHLASAFDVPVFVLFSQIYNYRQFVPYRVPSAFSVVPVPCAGCIYGCADVKCMKHDVASVLAQVREFCEGIDVRPLSGARQA